MIDDEIKTKERFLGLERAEWWFWGKWMIGWALGMGVGIIVAACLTVGMSMIIYGGPDQIGEDIVMAMGQAVAGFVGWVVGWAAVGAAQWNILQERVHLSGWWVLASMVGAGVGWAVGWVVGWALGEVVGWVLDVDWVASTWAVVIAVIVGGAVVGIAIGTAQWLILRERVHRSGWWVLANVLGWPVVGLVATDGLTGMIVGVTVVVAMTGLVLVLLLRHPIPEAVDL
jgi:hypothetical protein